MLRPVQDAQHPYFILRANDFVDSEEGQRRKPDFPRPFYSTRATEMRKRRQRADAFDD